MTNSIEQIKLMPPNAIAWLAEYLQESLWFHSATKTLGIRRVAQLNMLLAASQGEWISDNLKRTHFLEACQSLNLSTILHKEFVHACNMAVRHE